MDVRIGKRRGNQCGLIAARCSEWIYTGIVRCQVTIITDTCLTTRHSISCTYFQVVHNVVLREPAFLRNAPCGRYRRESTPAVLFTETTGTITTDSCRQHIAVFVRVVDTCHVREQRPFIGTAADGVHLLTVIHFMHIVEHEDVLLRIQVIILIPLCRRTRHHSHTMLFCKSMVEQEIVIPQVSE